jgi:hypothetical protein
MSLRLKSLPIPAPMAAMMARNSALAKMRVILARTVLRGFPRRGRMAWSFRSRACLALPPAESPSTMYRPVPAAFSAVTSASLLRSGPTSSMALRRATSFRAWAVAFRSAAAAVHMLMMASASLGFLSNSFISAPYTAEVTAPLIGDVSSSFVWLVNCGSGTST